VQEERKLAAQRSTEEYEKALKRREVEEVLASMDYMWMGTPANLPPVQKPGNKRFRLMDVLANKPRVIPLF
jgi:hypothetical protein